MSEYRLHNEQPGVVEVKESSGKESMYISDTFTQLVEKYGKATALEIMTNLTIAPILERINNLAH